jgi:hypothetical protein
MLACWIAGVALQRLFVRGSFPLVLDFGKHVMSSSISSLSLLRILYGRATLANGKCIFIVHLNYASNEFICLTTLTHSLLAS